MCLHLLYITRARAKHWPAVWLWAPIFSLHPAPIRRSTRSRLILLIKLTVQMKALYVARSRSDFVQHIVALPAAAMCYVCAAKSNDLCRPWLTKWELYSFCRGWSTASARGGWVCWEIWMRVPGLYGPVGFWGRASRLSC